MSNQRFSPEFKHEAVRQIVDCGYSVAEVSERLGGSAHSLYKWVKAIKPDKTDEQVRNSRLQLLTIPLGNNGLSGFSACARSNPQNHFPGFQFHRWRTIHFFNLE